VIDRMIAFSALGCLVAAFLLFLSRMLYIVTPESRAYGPVIWAFVWVFGIAIVLGDVYLSRLVYRQAQAQTPRSRWTSTLGAFLGLLLCGAFALMTLSVGMNFMGQ